MQLSDYFEEFTPDDIRIRGTRVGIETVLYEYVHGSRSPEAIASRYPPLSLEQVYATITYYLHNEASIREYLDRWLTTARQRREQQQANPPSTLERLRNEKQVTAPLTAN